LPSWFSTVMYTHRRMMPYSPLAALFSSFFLFFSNEGCKTAWLWSRVGRCGVATITCVTFVHGLWTRRGFFLSETWRKDLRCLKSLSTFFWKAWFHLSESICVHKSGVHGWSRRSLWS
jgi:hypothetical protein